MCRNGEKNKSFNCYIRQATHESKNKKHVFDFQAEGFNLLTTFFTWILHIFKLSFVSSLGKRKKSKNKRKFEFQALLKENLRSHI